MIEQHTAEIERMAIYKAYDNQVRALFNVLVASLTHDDEQLALKRFNEGITLARRARTLALDALAKQEAA